MISSTILVLLVLWGLLVLVGFVHLATDADLTESIRNWFTKATETDTSRKYDRLRRFIGRILQCQPCSGAWCAFPAAGLMVGFGYGLGCHLVWLVVTPAVVATPLTGIGLMSLLERMSPTTAADRVVDAMVDVAKEALTVADRVLAQSDKTVTKETTDV